MDELAFRELRNRVEAARHIAVKCDGLLVRESRPISAKALSAATRIELWHRMRAVDPPGLRRGFDSAIESGL